MGRGTRPKARTDQKILQNQRRAEMLRTLRRQDAGSQSAGPATVSVAPDEPEAADEAPGAEAGGESEAEE